MSFVGQAVVVPLRIRNPFAGAVYPEAGEVEAVLDTGYAGFVFVPEKVFRGLGMRNDKTARGVLADGSELELHGAYGSVEFGSQGVTADGLVQTSPGASEVLLGIDGIRGLSLWIDSCTKSVLLERC